MPKTLEYHRDPTSWEIKFGEGATHYIDVPSDIYLKKDGKTIKKWVIMPDGLRYSRY